MYTKITQTLREAYNQRVEERDSKGIAPWKAKERDHFLRTLRADEKTSLLEIGAGTGKFGQYFQAQGLDVICTDLSPAMVEACRQKGLDAHVMDFLNLDFAANSFDALFAMNTLLHVPKAEFGSVLKSVSRILKPGGLFYLGQYGGNDFEGTHETDHYRPKRFFSHFTNGAINRHAVALFYDIVYFETVTFDQLIPEQGGQNQKTYNFQSLILRNQINEDHHSK